MVPALRLIALCTVMALALAEGGCVRRIEATAPSPSPRPECAATRAVLYFQPDSAALLPTSDAIVRDIMDRIGACRAAGGEVRDIEIVSYADRTATQREARSEIRARANAVRDALIAAGAPAESVRIAREKRNSASEGRIMQRRTEISLDLY